ncbi:EcsC family protein [Alkalihalobacillus sp. CinArs1]|uniref:EcsC family protein n=1 Tax=Alkalihalobacillus sp. CinArs1 TaxID=2995314 RepID=UPI0022DD97A7|nr:EcsC family protein [Alkalihalobacillus sp. CinArs1]
MNSYEEELRDELFIWEKKMTRKAPLYSRATKKLQNKVNDAIPERVHTVVTNSIRTMVEGVLAGNTYAVKEPLQNLSLKERDRLAKEATATFKRVAAVEGAGTGAGGILLGLADFPLLLSIKMKFLFDLASIYGYDARRFEERVFILTIFQLAFSSDKTRKEIFKRLKNWEETSHLYKEKDFFNEEHNWKSFQLEYRDYIDLPKLLQMIPGFGAIVGAFVNYHFIDWLGETAMNAYRYRMLASS